MQFSKKEDFITACRTGGLCPKHTVGVRFERSMFPRRFRDMITFYRDGRIRFERYCFGEAAGLVCGLWASGIENDGALHFQPEGRHYSGLENAPARLTEVSAQGLRFDNTKDLWFFQEALRSDPKNGYRRFSFFHRQPH
ncbi:MAG: hypothetical protein Q4G07_09515 [Oscillospiraceae bacterium]|nr:hypothetical protein [Oscillospiraceae bacterium]